MSNCELLIFDWDGTLADSIGRIVQAMHQAADACDLPRLDDAAVKGIIGLALPEAIAHLYPQLTGAASIEVFRQRYSEQYLALEHQPSPLFPGVVELLAKFREQGLLLAVATGKSRRGLDRVLAAHRWEDYFDITRCADETASKPDPLMLDEILAHCGKRSDQAVMIGDSIFDLQMAQRAGMDAIAVSYGAQAPEVLALHSPQRMINRFEELSGWLAARNASEVECYVG
ncbi:HAD-IA family hydrolase [Stutzerimonas azotifigens]|uniref:HAD-IA family hydrolase n=1 Tax=Stutzerimonas azotifigens TaxID=291995 RepID=A0ABR5YXX8_9GAMM|nr:HAD-IA family hydrolase [Stutzerimonas azotifigens]MBA1272756.1 HAD-IA family hydrolase [Stutzerimonas azotifigens]